MRCCTELPKTFAKISNAVMTSPQIDISVVVPVYNEEENVPLLHQAIRNVLDKLKRPYEILFVDDGSSDGTFESLLQVHRGHPKTRIIKLRRNFGQSAAMAAGFRAAHGDVIISMDGDLQNDPGDIPRLVEKLSQGYDVVSGWRKDRKDKFLVRKVPSKIANWLICSVTGVKLHDTGCSLRAYRARVIKRIRLYGELHRFIPALTRLEGARITEMVVRHHARKYGSSKYNLTRTFKVLMDLTTLNLLLKHFSNPLRFFTLMGAVWIGIGSVSVLLLIFDSSIIYSELNILISVILLFLILGFQFFFFGLLAALVVATGQRKNIYLSETFERLGKS